MTGRNLNANNIKDMKQTTQEELIDLWLVPYHGLTAAELIAKEPPELLQSPDWWKKYAVTQQQHDEWYEAAITLLSKRTGLTVTRT